MNRNHRHAAVSVRAVRVLVAVASVALISGCGTTTVYRHYDDLSIPDSKVAKIIAQRKPDKSRPGPGRMTNVERVDGRRLPGWWRGQVPFMFPHPPRDIYLLPGEHDLLVKFTHGDLAASGHVRLVAEAGAAYTIKAITKGYGVHFLVERAESEAASRITDNDGDPAKPTSAE